MGTDNVFHRRKARSTKDLQRRGAQRKAYRKILIVCEGEKTEPNYFMDAREYYSLSSVNVEVRGDCGSAPKSVVKFAQQRYQEEKEAGDPYDQVYCVFDKDGHESYIQALENLKALKPKNTFISINSVPCFEYWLLLHFIYTTRPYTALPSNSSGNQVFSELKRQMGSYEKGRERVFNELFSRLEVAISHAERALQESVENNTDNPSTRAHILIKTLQSLKD